MGIPAAFRWLSTKYPKIVSPVVEDKPITLEDGTVIPVDTTQPNPNGEEFDNLYLDMNGIVHPCSHPEDRPAPKDEEEMMIEVFKYTDRVVNMVRPRKILMIAVDGVAPRAKMNQQRSRRFRSAREAKEKEEEKQAFIEMFKKPGSRAGKQQPVEEVVKKAFDSNSITPGTPFMDILAVSLRYWCSYKLNTDPAWANIKVIISDATVPGEGEHKIMDFVRSQRLSPAHDPNTRHVIYGLDADLIMLGLATHEPHFRVLREDVFFQEGKVRMCKICGQKGHDERNCRGEAKEKEGEFGEKEKAHPLKPFIWLHVSILREYLAIELDIPGLPFRFDLERAIDDWVFMCFFVGNDFLPHLPALEIRENGIDTLMAIWRDNLPHMGGYLTKDGRCDLERAQCIMSGLAKQEDAIFRRRKETEDRREAGFKRRKLQQEERDARNGRGGKKGSGGNQESAAAIRARIRAAEASGDGIGLFSVQNIPKTAHAAAARDMLVNQNAADLASVANKSAASVLKSKIQSLMDKGAAPAAEDAKDETTSPASALGKRKASLIEEESNASTPGATSSDADAPGASEEPTDTVRLWEEGYADRYYQQKFKVDPNDIAFRHKVARAYVEGLCWVLEYYSQGCPSWEWYYPYHYAPFAADFVDMGKMTVNFEKGRVSRPFEQLMSVLPAASRASIPEVYHELMLREDSEIIDFYPEEFEIDLNGKKMAWQGVALLPFIDMPRLLTAMATKDHLLSEADRIRNGLGKNYLILSDAHPTLYEQITSKFYSKKAAETKFELDPQQSDSLSGTVEKMENYIPHGELVYPLERNTLPGVEFDRSLTVYYEFPNTGKTHKSMLLQGAKMPAPALDRNDIEELRDKKSRSGRSYGGVPFRGGYNGGNRGGMINYGPQGGRGQRGGGYGNGQQNYQRPPPNWQPPPPGLAGFGSGPPPPPPPGYGGYNQGYGNDRFAPPPQYGGHQGGNQGGHQGGYQGQQGGYQGYQSSPPPQQYGGQDRRYDNRNGGSYGGNRGGSRGGRDRGPNRGSGHGQWDRR
ncbi:XRN 5'-3' exonuclease N-terminus-domain-containing protein [Immersiella caudata]|uniref:5'-3' exoribonuclease n=1 Tax=Immersiella caudata TaxID=314043 RepID=A0AA39X2J5_9PEZI|nr:XRN 5'-3' exonuclease N-terminus-domain-containing protein [Immersiella caudata]